MKEIGKKKKINMYCGAYYEYRQGVVHELINRGIIDFCLTEYFPDESGFKMEEDDRIVTYNPVHEVNFRIDKYIDINSIPPLDKELMEKMLPYESMAIKLVMRATKFPVVDYEIGKRYYYQQLRFWDYVFKKYDINFVYLRAMPHSLTKYVIYGLTQVYDIPLCICAGTSFDGRYVHGTGLGKMGITIGEKYDELKQIGKQVELTDPVIKEYWEVHTKRIEDIKTIINPGKDKYTLYMQKLTKKAYQGDVIGIKGIKKYPGTLWRTFKTCVRERDLSLIEKERLPLRHLKNQMISIRRYRHIFNCSLNKYNKYATLPDYSKKYIYFALQLTPEASTMSTAGVFAEQYNSIQLLAKCAEKNGVLVYVKEHYVQPSRSIDFYEDIMSIKNVRMIKTTIATYDLISNSIAVATQNGTCILEGLLMNKPAIVIGDSCMWKKMPGVFEIDNYLEGARIVNSVLNGVTVERDDLKTYFHAIECECVHEITAKETSDYWETGGKEGFRADKELVEEKINLIKRYINMFFNNMY